MLNSRNFTGDYHVHSVQISLHKIIGLFCRAAKCTESITIILATLTVLCKISCLIFCHTNSTLQCLCLTLMDPKNSLVFGSDIKEHAK